MDASGRLARKIGRRIAEAGIAGRHPAESGVPRDEVRGIPFRDYMAMCLYDEEFGYYRSGEARVGREGDFYTSSHIGSLMGEMLAAYIARSAARLDLPARVMEWGAGTGRLAVQMMAAWRDRYPSFAAELACVLVDGNPSHRRAAKTAVASAGFAGQASVAAPEQGEASLHDGRRWIIAANELLDAFPVHRVTMRNGCLWELGVAAGAGGEGFRTCLLPLRGTALADALAADGIALSEGQEAEIGLDGLNWLARLLGGTAGGLAVFIDYGGTAAELTGPHRMNGTLLCYRKHAAHGDPLAEPGAQDLTAHVNFSAVTRTAEAAGWRTVYYGTQLKFLVECGILEELQEHRDPDPFGPAARRNRAIRQLLLSDGMSETFKVAVYAK